MANNETVIVDVKPACYCCYTEEKLSEQNNGKGLNYWLCSRCEDATFQKVDGLYILVCPTHGEQKHYDVKNVRMNEKKYKNKAGTYYYPSHTKRTKEQGLKPMFGLARSYDEFKE